jgi:hypothetical protein
VCISNEQQQYHVICLHDTLFGGGSLRNECEAKKEIKCVWYAKKADKIINFCAMEPKCCEFIYFIKKK